MAVQVLLPKLGLTMETGSIEEWLVEPGTAVKAGDPLVRLGTDKVDADVEAEDSGVFHPVVAVGSDLPPGTLIGWLPRRGRGAARGRPGRADRAADDATDLVVAEPGAAVPADSAPERPSSTRTSGRLFASPNAKRVARERGVDIEAAATAPARTAASSPPTSSRRRPARPHRPAPAVSAPRSCVGPRPRPASISARSPRAAPVAGSPDRTSRPQPPRCCPPPTPPAPRRRRSSRSPACAASSRRGCTPACRRWPS